MGIRGFLGMSAIVLAVPCHAFGADFDGATSFVCAPVEITSCGAGSECSAESAASINLPQFLRVNASGNAITGKRPGGEALSTAILTKQSHNGRLVLQGSENGLSWTMSIDEDNGEMTVTAAGEKVAFIAFGACVRP
jgi:hypothetical protein